MIDKRHIRRVNDVDINIVDVGEGRPALLFLHYWGGSVRSWLPVMRVLADTNRCVGIDFRGWGRSGRDVEDYGLETLAEDVLGVIEDLALDDFTIVGHSMGGKVAQLVAAAHPKGLRRLILMAPAPPSPIVLSAETRQAMVASYQSQEAMLAVISAIPLSDPVREQIVEDALGGTAGAGRHGGREAGMARGGHAGGHHAGSGPDRGPGAHPRRKRGRRGDRIRSPRGVPSCAAEHRFHRASRSEPHGAAGGASDGCRRNPRRAGKIIRVVMGRTRSMRSDDPPRDVQ
ncbi:alpha/beta fold hydrolase [Sphingomonas faeni]|uniref:alpha/beta fold hydrolase n=1 Tax=Sphingomonas faeni TaxID=185950 RepID=UPI00334E485B